MFDENQLTFNQIQLLNEEGNISDESELTTDDNELLEMYKWMKRARLTDEKLMRMQRQGRIGTYAPFSGQEAAQVGSAYALKKSDWICPSYRDIAASMVHGMPLEQTLYYVKGHLSGCKTPDDLNILPVQIIIAAQTLHAVGLAHAAKLKGESSVSVSYFGDGATSEGDFHEALNFASVYKLPVVFFCQNNQYAISVPLKKQMGSRTIAQKAISYGIKGVQVDGNDVLAVHEVMKESAERARNGEGPTLIEAVTYRFGPHTTSDDPSKYREELETEEWINKKDPLIRLKRLLEDKGLWNDKDENDLVQKFEKEINDLVQKIEEQTFPNIEDSFEHVYKDMSHHLLEQQQNAKDIRQGKGGDIHE